MALYNLFGGLALDASVMATTPLLKQIDADLLATPYVRVVNPNNTINVTNFPSLFNVNVANPSTPATEPGVINVNLANVSTPPTSQSVLVTNFPQSFNVNVANTTTPPTVQNVNLVQASTPLLVDNPVGQTLDVNIMSTPISYVVVTNQISSGVSSFPTPLFVDIVGQTTPLQVTVVANPATPVVMAQFANQTLNVAGSFTANPPAMQNINFAEQATPVIVAFDKTPGQATPVVSAVITNMPPVIANVAAAPMQNVNFASQATPVQISFGSWPGQATPVVSAVISNMPPISVTANPPVMQNVNFAQQATPVQVAFNNTPGQATPVVSLAGWPATVNTTVGNFPATQNVVVTNYPTPLFVDIVGQTTPIQTVTIITSTPVVSAQLTNNIINVGNFPASQPISGTVNVGNFNALAFATPLLVDIVGQTTPITTFTQLTSTPIVYTIAGNNVQQVAFTATPVVSAQLLNNTISANIGSTPAVTAYQPFPYAITGSVSVGNFPATQNVQVMNFATPQPVAIVQQTTPLITTSYSTPITYAYQPYPYAVNVGNLPATPIVYSYQGNASYNVSVGNFPTTQNVQVMNFATPQPVLLVGTATPIAVNVQQGNVAVSNFPATYPTQGVVNVNIANQTTPAILATPIVYSYQPFPYSVVGTVTANVAFPGVQNVNIANVATPPSSLQFATPAVTAYQPYPYTVNVANFNALAFATPLLVDIVGQTTPIQVTGSFTSNPPVMQNINFAQQATPVIVAFDKTPGQATPVVSAVISNMPPISVTANPPVMQNVNFAQQATPVTVSFNNTPGQATPTVNAIVDGNVASFIMNTSQPTGSTAQAVPVNVVQAATPVYVNIQNVTATPVVYAQIINEPVAQSYLTANWYAFAGQCTPVLYTGGNNVLVKSITFTSTQAAVGPVALQATPSPPLIANPSQAGMAVRGIGSRQIGVPSPVVNLSGPHQVAIGGSVTMPAVGDAGNYAFWLGMGTPLYAWNCSGHLSYMLM